MGQNTADGGAHPRDPTRSLEILGKFDGLEIPTGFLHPQHFAPLRKADRS
jgi:hypothetical protein